MRKIYQWMIAAALLLMAQGAWAQDATLIDGVYYVLNNEDKTAEVVKPSGFRYEGDIVVPDTVKQDGHLATVSQWIEGESNALLITYAWEDGELRSKTTDQSSVLMVYDYEPGDAPAQALFSRIGYSEADELCPQGCFGTLPLHMPSKQTVTLTLNGVEMSKRTTEYTYTVTAGRLTAVNDTYNYFLHWGQK